MKTIKANSINRIADRSFGVLFTGKNCPACVALKRVIGTIEQGNKYIYEISVDENPAEAAEYRVMGLPTMLFVSNGKVQSMQVGAIAKMTIVEELEAL